MTGNQEIFQKAMSQGNSAAWDQNWEMAASYFQQALTEIPDHPLALNNLGLALFEQQRWPEALKVYRRAAAVTPTDPVPWEKVATIYERQGMLKEAIQASIQAAELHLKARNVEKAVENFTHALSMDPNHLAAHNRLAMIFDKTGKKTESVTEYISIASLLQTSGDITKAMQAVQYALSLIPNHPEAMQAFSMLRNGQRLPPPARPKGGTGPMKMSKVRSMASADALPAGKAVIKGQDPIIEARQAALEKLAGYLFEMAEDITAPAARRGLDTLMRGASSLTGDADRSRIHLHLSAAIDAQSQGSEQAAAADLERAIDAGLSSPAAYFDLGLLLVKQDPDQALIHLQRSSQVAEFAIASHLLIGQIYLARDQVKEAALAYLHALQMADMQTVPAEQSFELLQSYESVFEGQLEHSGEAVLRKLCANLVNQLVRPNWHEYLMDARRQMPGQADGGAPIPLAEMLLESRSSQVVTALTRVRDLSTRGKIHAALDEALYALEFAPTYLPLHVQIGELLLKEDHNTEAAEKFLMVASLYSLRGESVQAVRLLQRVCQLAPADVNIRTRLIDMLTSLGRTEEAVQQIVSQAEMYIMLADLESARQTYFTALTLTQKSAKTRPLGIQILIRIADIDMQRLDWRSALRTYEQLRTMQPTEPAHRQHLVDLNLRLGMEKEALAEVESFLAVMDTGSHRTAAAQFLEEILADYPGQLEMRRHLADLYIRLDNREKAIEQLDLVADGLLTAERIAETITVVETIINLDPPNAGEYRALLAQLHANK